MAEIANRIDDKQSGRADSLHSDFSDINDNEKVVVVHFL